jgi:hypothetical protein
MASEIREAKPAAAKRTKAKRATAAAERCGVKHVPVGDPIRSSVGSGEPIIVDIDKEWMDSRPHGVLTLPLQVTGHWKLMVRVWVATRLLYMAARLLNYGVKVESDEPDRT